MNTNWLAAVVALLGCTNVVFGVDKEIDFEGMNVKIMGQSGKISLTDANGTKTTFEMDSIKEMDSSGEEVGKAGKDKHSFNTFATLDFEFGSPEDAEYNGVDVKKIAFNSDISIGDKTAKLMVDLMIFKENGNFTVGNVDFKVVKGAMKYNIILESWPYCGTEGVTCGEKEVGEFVEFTLTVKGGESGKLDNADDQNEKLQRYAIGNDQYFYMVTEINADGEFKDMRDGYPKLVIQGAKDMYMFAIPKCEKAEYDPMAQTAPETYENYIMPTAGDGQSGGSATKSSFAVLCLASIFAVIFFW